MAQRRRPMRRRRRRERSEQTVGRSERPLSSFSLCLEVGNKADGGRRGKGQKKGGKGRRWCEKEEDAHRQRFHGIRLSDRQRPSCNDMGNKAEVNVAMCLLLGLFCRDANIDGDTTCHVHNTTTDQWLHLPLYLGRRIAEQRMQ